MVVVCPRGHVLGDLASSGILGNQETTDRRAVLALAPSFTITIAER